MGRLSGLPSFLVVIAAMAGLLRLLHVGAPALFPETRPGPLVVDSLDAVERRAGFRPLVPAYRPASLGERPPTLTVSPHPQPTVLMVWRGEHYLTVSQRRGGAPPATAGASRPLLEVPDSRWWSEGAVNHAVLRRGALWVVIETDLPPRDLQRLARTLHPWTARRAPPPWVGQGPSTEMTALRIA